MGTYRISYQNVVLQKLNRFFFVKHFFPSLSGVSVVVDFIHFVCSKTGGFMNHSLYLHCAGMPCILSPLFAVCQLTNRLQGSILCYHIQNSCSLHKVYFSHTGGVSVVAFPPPLVGSEPTPSTPGTLLHDVDTHARNFSPFSRKPVQSFIFHIFNLILNHHYPSLPNPSIQGGGGGRKTKHKKMSITSRPTHVHTHTYTYFTIAPSTIYCFEGCRFHTFNLISWITITLPQKLECPPKNVKCTGWSCAKLVIRSRAPPCTIISASHWIIKLEKLQLLHMEWNYQRPIQTSPSLSTTQASLCSTYKPCIHEKCKKNNPKQSNGWSALILRLFTVIGISTQIVYGYWLRAGLNTSDSFASRLPLPDTQQPPLIL